MAITRLSSSSLASTTPKYASLNAGYPVIMAAPTATDSGTGSDASIAFTTQSGATSYTAISTPGSYTGTGASSPITVSGLTAGTSYTFQVRATNSVGTGAYSAASNSLTLISPSSYELIQTQSPSGTGTVTFSSIPSDYAALEVWFQVYSAASLGPYMRFNSDTGANYIYSQSINAQASGTTGFAGTVTNYAYCGLQYNACGTDDPYGGHIVIPDYASSSIRKSYYALGGHVRNAAATFDIQQSAGYWDSNSAITTLDFILNSNMVSGSVVSLYGIKG